MSYQLATHLDPPDSLPISSPSSLPTTLPLADPTITYRPDLSAFLVPTDTGTAFYSLTPTTLVCYLIVGPTTLEAATAARTASRSKLLTALRAATSSSP